MNVEKEYHVKLSGALTQEDLKRAVTGLPLDKSHVYRFKTIASLKKAEKNTWYRVTVTEGQIPSLRKVAEALSHSVLKLRACASTALRWALSSRANGDISTLKRSRGSSASRRHQRTGISRESRPVIFHGKVRDILIDSIIGFWLT